jgi:microcin C transport system permease protein
MRISPDLKDKLRKFRKSKRSYYSFIAVTALFVLTLPAELMFNDRPLVLSIDGSWYFPVFKDYTYKDLGGSQEMPVTSYKSKFFHDFLEGMEPHIDVGVLFQSEEPNYDPEALPGPEELARARPDKPLVTYTQGEPHDVWMLWPMVRHSYKSSYTSTVLPAQRLANPFGRTTGGGKDVPGASAEGHYLGTDDFGKDVLARLVYGFRLSVGFGLAVAFFGTALGCIIGGLQGYFGGMTDLLGQRATEIWGAIPQLLLLMLLMDSLSSQGEMSQFGSVLVLFFIVNLTSWMGMSAHMRAQFLRARNLDYVRAAKALGVSDPSIMARHILPNSIVPIITFLPFSVSGAIMALVGLDFLGFGLKYPAPSLGEMLAQGQQYLHAWWILTPTFVVLCALMIMLTFVGDGVRNAFDTRFK